MNLKETLYCRVTILEDNQVISRRVATYTREMIDRVLEKMPYIQQERAEMFFTHLAMAGKRAEEGIRESSMDTSLFEDLKKEPVYAEAVILRDEILYHTDIAFPETEKDFLSVHICNLLNR